MKISCSIKLNKGKFERWDFDLISKASSPVLLVVFKLQAPPHQNPPKSSTARISRPLHPTEKDFKTYVTRNFLFDFCLLHFLKNRIKNSLKLLKSAFFIENLKTRFSSVKNKCLFCPKKSHFNLKLACFERDKTSQLFFGEIFRSRSICHIYYKASQKTKQEFRVI